MLVLHGEKCILRPLRVDDATDLARLMENMEGRENIRVVFPTSEEELARWIEGLYRKKVPRDIVFAIDVEGTLIGTVSLHDINWTSRHGTLTIAIYRSDYRGRGIGTEATSLILDYAFDLLNLHRVKLEVYEYNKTALHIYEKLGFVKEGVWRSQRYLRGKYYDVVLMGILKDEWYKRREELGI